MDITELCTDLAKTQTYVKQLEDLPAKVALDKLDHTFQQFLKGLNLDCEKTNGTGIGSTLPIATTTSEEEWLTDEQATKWLGITDEYVLWLLVHYHGFRYKHRNGHMMIPLSELERMQDSSIVWDTRASGHAHERIGGNYMTQEEMDELSAARPGRLPWKK
jgi:hypothetical protein